MALLCPEARLRRILRLALQADGYHVAEWSDLSAPPTAPVEAVVMDLDGLRWRPMAAIARLEDVGVSHTTGLLLISVYPPEPDRLQRLGPLDYLQPPFAPREFADRVRRLLATRRSPAPRRRGRANPVSGDEPAGREQARSERIIGPGAGRPPGR